MHFRLTLLLASVTLLACSNPKENNKSETQQKQAIQNEVAVEAKEDAKIQGNSFRGIRPGDLIDSHKEKLQAGKIKRGNSVKEVLIMEEKGLEVGYVVPNREDKRLVGNITILSEEFATDRGIRVGNTLKEALKMYPNLNVKQMKNGKKVYVTDGKVAFLLDIETDKKNLVLKKIPETTVILEIKFLS